MNQKLWDDGINEIRTYTENNDVFGALLGGCDLLTDLGCHVDDIKAKFEQMENEQQRVGYSPQPMVEERYGVYRKLMTVAKAKLGKKLYNEFHMSF